MKKCKTKFCRNKAKKGRFCSTCYSKQTRLKNPIRYCYQALKDNAKRRGKYFDLTYMEFQKFCIEKNYLQTKGRNANSASIDRIENDKGYTINNLQILSVADNTKKELVKFKIKNGYYPKI